MQNFLKNRTSLNMEAREWIKGPLDHKFMSRGKFLFAYEAIKTDINELQEKYRPMVYDKKIDTYYPEDFYPENGKYEELMNDVKAVREKYGLSPSFDRNIFYYILHGDPLTWTDSQGGPIYAREHWFPYRFNTGETIMAIPVYPETSIQDITDFWHLITKAKRQFYGHSTDRVIPRKNLERDIEIFKLKQQGYKGMVLYKEVKKLYPNAKISYPDISRIIKRLKNMP